MQAAKDIKNVINARIYRPVKYTGDFPGEKKRSKHPNAHRTSQVFVQTLLSEYPAVWEDYPLNDVVDEAMLMMRRLYQTEGYCNWNKNEYDTAAKKNKVNSNLPKYIDVHTFKISNSYRIEKLFAKEGAYAPMKLTLTFKGNFMGRTLFTLEFIEELRKLIIYCIKCGVLKIDADNVVDIDKLLWLLVQSEKKDPETVKYLQMKTIDKDRYSVKM
jgi:hypothetical protein